MRSTSRVSLFLLAFALAGPALADTLPAVVPPADEADEDRHAGYYYPEPVTSETYTARGKPLAEADRGIRIGFVTGLKVEITRRGHPIPYAVFAKGAEAEKLIVVALVDGPLDTLYRARAVLANLTAEARLLPILRDNGVDDLFTFFDLCRLIGFEQITLSDGKTWSHQVLLR